MINATTHGLIGMEQFTVRPGLEWKLSITPITILIDNPRTKVVYNWLVAWYMENE